MALARNTRQLKLDKCWVEPISQVLMLSPKYNPDDYEWDKTHWDLLPAAANFVESRSADIGDGYYLGYVGDVDTAWAAYLNASTPIAADRAQVFNIKWFPSATALTPFLEFFPRMDLSKYATINGYTYYFCPIVITIDMQANLTVYEYEFDNYTVFQNDPAKMLTKSYQHSMLFAPGNLQTTWLQLTLIPTENDGFVLLSPQLKDGGFAYYSRLKRQTVKMFPEGSAGIRSQAGGLAAFSIYPVDFETTGTAIGPPLSKREEDTKPVSITIDSWLPSGTGVIGVAIDPTTEENIETDAVFKDYTYKLTLTGTGAVSPVVYWVKCEIEGEGEDKTPTDIDISNDVIITEQTSEDLIGYSATVRLRNIDGVYNELLYRPLNEIDFDLLGEDRAVLYTLEPQFKWWETPYQEAMWIEWQCGDGWVRLKNILCAKEPAYDGLDLKTVVETFLQRQGYDITKIHVDATAADIVLPEKRGSKDYLFQPADGKPAADFLRELWESFCSTWVMYFDGAGEFYFKPADTAVSRVYYLSHNEADVAYQEDYDAWSAGELPDEPLGADYGYYVLGGMDVRVLHEQFKNEVWVLGWDDATDRALVALYLDVQSQIDEEYLFYTGDRRMLIVPTSINNQEVLQWICDQLATYYCTIRRQISFRTKYDAALRPTDLITFRGTGLAFRVASIRTNVGPNTWGRDTGDIADCTIEALEWPVG